MTQPDQTPRTPGAEQLTPFDQAVNTTQGILDSDPRTQHYEAGEPVTEGMTHSITFGEHGVSRHVDERGTTTLRVRNTTGQNDDDTNKVWVLNPRTRQARTGSEDPSYELTLSGMTAMPDSDYAFLTGRLPELFADAKRNKQVGYPLQPGLRGFLGSLAVRRSRRR